MAKAVILEKDMRALSINQAPKADQIPTGIMASSFLFDPSELSKQVGDTMPDGYTMRPLSSQDYSKGFLECLSQLTTVGDVSDDAFLDRFQYMKERSDQYRVVVIEELTTKRIVASGTIFAEKKFIRGCGIVGHIEDIVVHDSQRGKSYGKRIIEQLTHVGKQMGCYKIILCCDEKNVGFYEKCGYEKKEVEMVLYFK